MMMAGVMTMTSGEDEGVLCCQGASVLLREKLINWLRCVFDDTGLYCERVCMCVCGVLWTFNHSFY